MLRSAAAAASQSLVVSYPRMDVAQSRARVPSFYALEVVRAAEGRLPSLREFEKRAARAASSRLDWPAPANPREAIDDAEYDLASLQAALKLRGAAAVGSARYLMQANESLARSLRTRGRRWRNFWSSADGIVDPDPATLAALGPHRLANRSYSPSSLQHFAACPYRFLLQAVYQFRPREEPAPWNKWTRLRAALFSIRPSSNFSARSLAPDCSRLRTTSYPLRSISPIKCWIASPLSYEDDFAPAIPRVWKSEIENLRTDLARMAAARGREPTPIGFRCISSSASASRPIPHRDPASTSQEAVILDGIRLRGSIDLIERHATSDALRVTDHKTGKSPKDRPQYVGGGAILQPLLYALAAETLLGRICCNQAGSFSAPSAAISLPSISRSTTNRAQRLRRVLETIDRSIEEGFLPAAPQTGACALCDYSAVCGPYEETRVKRKQADRLDPLIEIRHSP